MKVYGKDLIFISRILRDGSGTELVNDDKKYLDDERFKVLRLSITYDTYIANGFNSFVVKLKKQP